MARTSRYFENGFMYGMDMTDKTPVLSGSRVKGRWDSGYRWAAKLTKRVGGHKRMMGLLFSAWRLQAESRRLNPHFKDSPPPCNSCVFIGVCKQTALCCDKYLEYCDEPHTYKPARGLMIPVKSLCDVTD